MRTSWIAVRVRVSRLFLHPLEHRSRELRRRGVERGELDVLLLAEVHADQRVEAVQQLLHSVDVGRVCFSKPLDPRDDRLVVVDHRHGGALEADTRTALPHRTVFTHIEPVEDPASFDDTTLDRDQVGNTTKGS